MRTRVLLAATLGGALLALPAVASAHAPLESSTPKAGDNLDTAPSTVTLTFAGELDPLTDDIAVVLPAQTVRALEATAGSAAGQCNAVGNRQSTGRLEQRSWETQDGDKRSVVEVVADEIGPSLRWATAKPERAAKATAASGRSNDDPPF